MARAAARLGVAVQTVSAQVHALEQALGVALFERVFGDSDLLRRQQKVRLAICELGCDLGFFERGGGSGLDLGFDLAEIFLCEVYVCHAVLLVAQGEHEVPICFLDVRDYLDRLAAKIGVGLAQTFLRDLDLLAAVVDAEISKQRLNVRHAEAGRIDRAGAAARDIARTELCLRERVFAARVVEKHLVITAAGTHESCKIGVYPKIARRRVAGRVASRKIGLHAKNGIINSRQRAKLSFLKTYVVARYLDIVVALKRLADRIIERQRHRLRGLHADPRNACSRDGRGVADIDIAFDLGRHDVARNLSVLRRRCRRRKRGYQKQKDYKLPRKFHYLDCSG